ncbi:hydrogenase formation protein HypD [Thermincola potens]|uniref:Hydrogenase expression/formation protein HypD n=1 Tax=Thermincola potens (strain JR) TaxID=635013 RepID=D5XEU1_THEPJ|nr:hydrogenase formation protein HypD [Thermincola potens]ADG82162.1 hydrogenase expression/formation protein HypD [Thermincola potens JR]
MKYLKEFRDSDVARAFIRKIRDISKKDVKLMEVCGTHTVSIFRHGIRDVLPPNIKLISGPGCPVCVTPNRQIDEALELCKIPGLIMTTFGDMMKVPGSYSSLAKEKARGTDIRIVYSTMDAVKLAQENPTREVVFFGIGFETTSPTIAAAVLAAERLGLRNFSVVGAQKLIPEAIRALLDSNEIGINGFICPGHVSSILGVEPYRFICEEYHVPAVIVGFEPLDMLQGIYMLVKQIEAGEAKVEIQYTRGVPEHGNPRARELLFKVFEISDAEWRGIGHIPGTGLKFRREYAKYDAVAKFNIKVENAREHPGCICGEVLRGVKVPYECKLFGKACVPENPVGACMVSTEGTCAAYYKYGTREG